MKEEVNIAKSLTEEERKEISKQVVEGYRQDVMGRAPWEERRRRFYKLWMTQRDPKSTPWKDASNVCLPLLAIACNQFHARSYQAMFTPANLVKALPIGALDVTRAKAVENFMNWQLLYDVPDYEDETDKLLLGVPINGLGFKKLGWDYENERPTTDYVSSVDLILPYRTRTLETARRRTHRIYLHYDVLKMRADKDEKKYIDFDKVAKGTPEDEYESPLEDERDQTEPEQYDQEQRPNLLIEQFLYYKHKDDKIAAPYLATVDYGSQTLLRMVKRVVTVKGKEAVFQEFVDYGFFPNPEGYYPFGFGHFLEQLNEMANTAFNQIFDSGRLSNQPFGFYGRRAGVRRKQIQLHPGLMQEVDDATQIYFPNMQRVDQILFQVLGLIQQYSEQFTSTSDYLLGRESRGTKTPTASGTLAIIEQGLVLYNTMIKRLFRSQKKELRTIAFLNQMNLGETKQYVILEDPDNLAFPKIRRQDFDGAMHIIPVGDPSYASKLSRRQEAAEIYQGILGNPLVIANPKIQIVNEKAVYEATKTWLETYDRRDFKKLLPKPKPEMIEPEDENAMIMQGDKPEVVPGIEVVHHLEVHERFKKSEFYRQMDAEYKPLLDKLIAEEKAIAYKQQMTLSKLGSGQPEPMPPEQMTPPMGAAAVPPEAAPMPLPASNQIPPAAMAINPSEALNGG